MTRTSRKTDQNVLPLAITSLVAVALTSVAVLVSANTQVPSSPFASANKTNAIYHSLQNELQINQLKHNTLSVLRAMPHYNLPPEHVASPAQLTGKARLTRKMIRRTTTGVVNVNTFLLSNRITNDSQLAELQMQPFFGQFDVQQYINNDSVATVGFTGVGFPHIETNQRADSLRYKPYKQLLSFSSNANGVIVPNVKCMGLSAESVAKRAEKYDAKIFTLAVKHKVSASLVKAVVAKESCFDPAARSRVGAIGLMQLMPETAQWLNVSKPENANQNLSAGVRYLAQLKKRFGSNELALAAYNAGPGNVERYNGIPPFAETQNYVQDVMHFYRGYVATTRFVNALNSFD